jgi:hypothetical protein
MKGIEIGPDGKPRHFYISVQAHRAKVFPQGKMKDGFEYHFKSLLSPDRHKLAFVIVNGKVVYLRSFVEDLSKCRGSSEIRTVAPGCDIECRHPIHCRMLRWRSERITIFKEHTPRSNQITRSDRANPSVGVEVPV